ncbi:Cdc6/Cdc18 family protein [Salinarchaeum chitinilyticum]
MAGMEREPHRTPFADADALTAVGVADGLPERAGNLEALESILEPSREGRSPVGVTLYGPSGAGKTELATQSVAEFRRAGGTVVHLECTTEDTVFTCCRRVANELGADLPESGLALETARDRAIDSLARAPAPRCIVLDDVDRLATDVRRTLVCDVVGSVDTDAALATIATSTPLTLRNDLDARERTILGDSERALACYDEAELRSIVERRAGRAFRDDALDAEVLDSVVEATMDRDADVGFGLELLAAAGEIAETDGTASITKAHLDRARDRVAVAAVAQRLEGLRRHQVLALRGLCALANEGALPARIGQAFDAYVDACTDAGESPNTERSLQNYLRRLVETGLVEAEEVRTENGGKFNSYDLTRSPSLVTNALDDQF